MKIGVFDSGLGGLTVLKRLIEKYPNNEYIYYGDTKNVPYGSKTKKELEELSSNIVEFLIKKNADVIIIACGTVSSNAYKYLKEKYNIPIIDIISPTIDYINNSKFKKIGLIATEATVKSNVFDTTWDLKKVACKEFVPLIESSNFNELGKYIDLYLKDLKDRDIIILGCTHYPIIRDRLDKYLNHSIKLLDMAECLPDIFKNVSKPKVNLYFSKLDSNILKNINNILDVEVDSISYV